MRNRLSPSSPLTSSSLTLDAGGTLKISLTSKEGKSGARPHQAFLTFSEQDTGLQESFPFSVKENGKAKIEVVCSIIDTKIDGRLNKYSDTKRPPISAIDQHQAAQGHNRLGIVRLLDALQPACLQLED